MVTGNDESEWIHKFTSKEDVNQIALIDIYQAEEAWKSSIYAHQSQRCYFTDESDTPYKILQIIHHQRIDRIHIIQKYEPFFAGQIFLIHKEHIDDWKRISNYNIEYFK